MEQKSCIFLMLVLPLSFGNPIAVESHDTDNTSTSSPLTDFHAHIHTDQNKTEVFNVSDPDISSEESIVFVKTIFARYGNENALSKKNLENMFQSLGIKAVAQDHSFHESHFERQHRSIEENIHLHSNHEECLEMVDLLKAFHLETNQEFTQRDFIELCPALVQQITLEECNFQHAISKTHEEHDEFDLSKISGRVWGFSTVAVVIISLVGLLGVAVIPIMQKVFYNHLLQFLVALAIGALSGDALLHLLPHSIAESLEKSHDSHEGEGGDSHTVLAWKGLVALIGILFFFITERLLTILTAIKEKRKSKKLRKKMFCAKYCNAESNEQKSMSGKLSGRPSNEDNCDKMVMLVHPNKALKSFADATHDEFLHQCDDRHSMMADDKGDTEPELEAHSDNGVDGPPNFSGHSHGRLGHGHGHGLGVPNSVAAVAWMVILGDGIHNFSDGLAIGAAFASSITGGFSTSVAVFCHELPHEIGDFAILLRAGMSSKQAVLYNCLSSILCFIGMLIGVSIGNISSASSWIFAIVGGMFLYIALVDMLPEMTNVDPKKGENPFLHLLFQVIGILLGSSIMLVIALYEDDIKKTFD